MQCKFKQLLSFALLTQFKHKNKAFQKYIFWQLFRNFYAAAKNSKKYYLCIQYNMWESFLFTQTTLYQRQPIKKI